jgi:dihydroneopterin aldolase
MPADGKNAVVVFVRDLRLTALIGVAKAEANCRQQVAVDAEITAPSPRGEEPAIDYAALMERLRALVKDRRFLLLEELAEEICALIFRDFPAAREVKIRCAKPRVFADVAAAGVEMRRTRPKKKAAKKEK